MIAESVVRSAGTRSSGIRAVGNHVLDLVGEIDHLEVAALDGPEVREARHQRDHRDRVALAQAATEQVDEVALLGADRGHRRDLERPVEIGRWPRSENASPQSRSRSRSRGRRRRRRAASGRTRAPSRAVGSAARAALDDRHQRLVHQGGERAECIAVDDRVGAAEREPVTEDREPAQRHALLRRPSRFQLQSMTASRVWWRSGASRVPPRSRRTGSRGDARSRRPTSPGPWRRPARRRAAARRGARPADRTSLVSRRAPGRAADARSVKSSAASSRPSCGSW